MSTTTDTAAFGAPKNPMGRRPKGHRGGPRRMYWDGQLHAMVRDRMPEVVIGGRVSMALLSDRTRYCKFTLYKVFAGDNEFSEGKISIGVMSALLNLSKELVEERKRGDDPKLLALEPLTEMELLPFLLKK